MTREELKTKIYNIGCIGFDTGSLLKEKFMGLKKFYIVDVKSSGIYHNISIGKRLFLSKSSAIVFYNHCLFVKCEVEFYTMKSKGSNCYFEVKSQ